MRPGDPGARYESAARRRAQGRVASQFSGSVAPEGVSVSADIQGADAVDDAGNEGDEAEHDGERSEAFSAFVSDKG